MVEIDFKVDTLRASLYKSAQDGTEKPLGDVAFQGFGLQYAMEKYVMTVDVNLRYVSGPARTRMSELNSLLYIGLCRCTSTRWARSRWNSCPR